MFMNWKNCQWQKRTKLQLRTVGIAEKNTNILFYSRIQSSSVFLRFFSDSEFFTRKSSYLLCKISCKKSAGRWEREKGNRDKIVCCCSSLHGLNTGNDNWALSVETCKNTRMGGTGAGGVGGGTTCVNFFPFDAGNGREVFMLLEVDLECSQTLEGGGRVGTGNVCVCVA